MDSESSEGGKGSVVSALPGAGVQAMSTGTLLSRVTTGKTVRPRRVLVYGVGGIGKSTFGSCAPSPIFLPLEDGLDDIDAAKLPLCTDYAMVCAALDELYTADHPYKTLVVDSLDWLERLIWDEVCRTQLRPVPTIEDIGYGRGYTFAMSQWRDILGGFDALRRDRGMFIVCIAHSKIEKFANPEGDAYDRYSPKLHKLASGLVIEWADEVLFARHKELVVTATEGQKVRARGVGTGQRVMTTTGRPAAFAKNRLDLPEEIELSWSAYASHFTK